MLTAVTDSTLQFFWFVQTQISSMLCCKREMLSVRACVRVCVSLQVNRASDEVCLCVLSGLCVVQCMSAEREQGGAGKSEGF